MKPIIITLAFFTFCLSAFSQDCPFVIEKWKATEKVVDKKIQNNILTDLTAAAALDIENLTKAIDSGKLDAKIDFGLNVKKVITKKKSNIRPYDKEIYEDMKIAQAIWCAVYSGLNSGLYDTPESRSDALKQLKEAQEYLLKAKKKAQS